MSLSTSEYLGVPSSCYAGVMRGGVIGRRGGGLTLRTAWSRNPIPPTADDHPQPPQQGGGTDHDAPHADRRPSERMAPTAGGTSGARQPSSTPLHIHSAPNRWLAAVCEQRMASTSRRRSRGLRAAYALSALDRDRVQDRVTALDRHGDGVSSRICLDASEEPRTEPDGEAQLRRRPPRPART